MIKIIYIRPLLILLLLIASANASNGKEYLTVKIKSVNNIGKLLTVYNLPDDAENIELFNNLNKTLLKKSKNLVKGKTYQLPVIIEKWDGKSIRSSLKITDLLTASRIQDYNYTIHQKGIKPRTYKKDNVLWVPVYLLKSKTTKKIEYPVSDTPIDEDELLKPHFGEKIKPVDNKLEGCVYYLLSGHGGPDPGAIGRRMKKELHEDEYSYDVTLRLAKKLKEHGAKVYMIIQDKHDGIRNDSYLNNSYDELYITGEEISLFKNRLQRRAEIINYLYQKNKNTSYLQQALEIHLDSRVHKKRIDIFFYYNEVSAGGKSLANTLLSTIRSKYSKVQPNKKYSGTTSSRELYMLDNTLPTFVYIELGNIQNSADQLRFINSENRQAVANWLSDGLVNESKKYRNANKEIKKSTKKGKKNEKRKTGNR